jgi:hypothetical protein
LIVSKKRFTEGMENLFGPTDKQEPDKGWFGAQEAGDQSAHEQKNKRSKSGKNFTNDLQSFLQEAFDNSMERQLEERQRRDEAAPATPSVKKKQRRPMAGLDALIRSTVDPQPEPEEDRSRPKRITLSFDPVKLEKLKSIARNQRALLGDVIDEIVEDYLNRMEANS